MADFEYVSINTTAEKIERIANMDIDDVTLDENSKDNSLPTSKLVFDTIKNEVENKIDQTYNPKSENAQSGKAVAEAVDLAKSLSVPRPKDDGSSFKKLIAFVGYGDNYELISDKNFLTVNIEGIGGSENCIPIKDAKGNLTTNLPINDLDCANKAYVDTLVGDIETLLGGI